MTMGNTANTNIPHSELRHFGDEVAAASREYFQRAGSDLTPFVCGLDILITTAVVWLRHATQWSRKEVEEALVQRVHTVCDLAFGSKEAPPLHLN